jgi:hypothetical protein
MDLYMVIQFRTRADTAQEHEALLAAAGHAARRGVATALP